MGGTFEGSNCWINGYGWISIALVIFANWSPAKAILGTFIFGFFNTLRVQNAPLATAFPNTLGWLTKIPAQFFSALPFIITLIVLILSSVSKLLIVSRTGRLSATRFSTTVCGFSWCESTV